MKKKLDELTKYKLIYSGELLIFAVIMTVLAFLFGFGIIPIRDWKKWLFSILTLIGGIWMIIDFIWTIRSEKKRKRSCMIDKIILVPSGLTLLGLDIYALVNLIINPEWCMIGEINFFQVEITCAIGYVAIVYYFEAIYHWFKIHPMVYEMIEEEKQQEEQKALENEESAKNKENEQGEEK